MSLNLELSQKLTISQQLVQSMEILQMSTLELESYIDNLALENPVMEIQENPQNPSDEKDELLRRKMEWLESTDLQNKVYYQEDHSDADMQNNWQDIRDSGEELSDYLTSQLLLANYTEEEKQIINYLICSLDQRGYYTEDPKIAADLFHVSEHTVLHLLQDIQELDPAGVGARDLKECLVLQLHRKKNYSRITETVILFYLDMVGKNHLPEIAKKMHVRLDDVLDACEEIKSFNPKPGNSFSNREQLSYISPDAVVVKMENSFEILVNEYQYPHFTISAYYSKMAKETSDPEARKYLHEKIQQAQTLQENIRMRTSTLSKIMHILVEKQYDFFLKGPGHKHPLRLVDIADAAGLHESTVSRTLRSKYLQCSWGVFPLNYFLTSIASTSSRTGEAQTPEFIKGKMKELIDHEDKSHPLSDDKISKKLSEMDIQISRRTVNKYRQEMGLPDKSGRKSWSR